MAKDRTAAEVAQYLRDFIEGVGKDWDWDDFTSVPIKDQRLDAIRYEANRIKLPATPEGFAKLQELLVRVQACG